MLSNSKTLGALGLIAVILTSTIVVQLWQRRMTDDAYSELDTQRGQVRKQVGSDVLSAHVIAEKTKGVQTSLPATTGKLSGPSANGMDERTPTVQFESLTMSIVHTILDCEHQGPRIREKCLINRELADGILSVSAADLSDRWAMTHQAGLNDYLSKQGRHNGIKSYEVSCGLRGCLIALRAEKPFAKADDNPEASSYEDFVATLGRQPWSAEGCSDGASLQTFQVAFAVWASSRAYGFGGPSIELWGLSRNC